MILLGSVPDVGRYRGWLSVREIRLVLEELIEPYRTMVLVAACLGLRATETVGLQWGDLNWADLTLLVRRIVVHG